MWQAVRQACRAIDAAGPIVVEPACRGQSLSLLYFVMDGSAWNGMHGALRHVNVLKRCRIFRGRFNRTCQITATNRHI